jgi:hypothetical protein
MRRLATIPNITARVAGKNGIRTSSPRTKLANLEAVPLFRDTPTLFTLHEAEWQWVATIGKQMSAAYGIDIDDL